MVFAGRDVRPLLEFPPPLEVPVDYLKFSWLAALAVLASVALTVAPWLTAERRRAGPAAEERSRRVPGTWPWWGTVALIWTIAWWVLAWSRFAWFGAGQRYTFFPLWLGFIVAVNAATQRRVGSCLMRRAPRRWLGLFGVSAVCWWGFEWLNRFVQNWHYLGAEGFGAASYALHATLCFSTVLPAVAAIAEWIATHRRWNEITLNGPRCGWLEARGVVVALLALGVASLLGTGGFPLWFYPALWVAPLLMYFGGAACGAQRPLAAEMVRGDWTRAATWMIASLACGFFWELWNWHSAAKWIYTVPGVDRWHLFEMPALGYVGYLPFGLECLIVADRVIGDGWKSRE